MITQSQPKADYQKLYFQLEGVLSSCHQSFEQYSLIKQLQQRATKLKIEIGQLKKLTSQEMIESLIIKRKQEKEAQRLKLQMSWRELTEKLKKYEEQDKKLADQNAQALFDIANLHQKIHQMHTLNSRLQVQINNSRSKNDKTFVTQQQKKTYISPYKYDKSQFIQSKNIKVNQQSQSQQCEGKIKKKLQQIRIIKKVPENILYQFLNKSQVKNQLFYILNS